MKAVFFIKSETINLSNYTLKDPIGSTGRLDVITRCALAVLLNNFKLEQNTEFWAFLDNYGTYIFKSELFQQETFPISELRFMDYFADIIQNIDKGNNKKNPLNKVIISGIDIFDAIEKLQNKRFQAYILHEEGTELAQEKFEKDKKYFFIIGNQLGTFLDSQELKDTGIPRVSLGTPQSYLASSVIKLIKLQIFDSFTNIKNLKKT